MLRVDSIDLMHMGIPVASALKQTYMEVNKTSSI